jgi:hypothetical protein
LKVGIKIDTAGPFITSDIVTGVYRGDAPPTDSPDVRVARIAAPDETSYLACDLTALILFDGVLRSTTNGSSSASHRNERIVGAWSLLNSSRGWFGAIATEECHINTE